MMSDDNIYAMVTGTSRGIGKCIAEKLLNEGRNVIGTRYKTGFPKEFIAHKNFEGRQVNLADSSQVDEILKPVFDRNDIPGVLINNAGVFEEAGMAKNDTDWLRTWDKTQQVNLRAPALLSKWAIDRWKKEAGGILINIASRAAYRGDTQEYSAYAASKAGLVAFTKSIARDFGKKNIVAYSIAPGFIKTDMASKSMDVYGEEYLTEGSAFDEITSPGEVAELVSFLAAGKVKHMTGATFHINGGSYMI
jgi:NAD(P)-dependent dehydrogenase (short-subunit alcohol dehydrogenase family)